MKPPRPTSAGKTTRRSPVIIRLCTGRSTFGNDKKTTELHIHPLVASRRVNRYFEVHLAREGLLTMPVLAMLLASMLFASSNIGNKIAVADLAVAEVVSGRFLFAAAVLWAMVLLTRQPVVWKEARRPLLMGLLDPGLVSLLIVSGLQYTSAVNVAVFWALMPLFTPIAARLVLGEKINNLVILGALVAVTGAIILAMANKGAGEGNLTGDFLAICGVLCAVGTALLGRRVAQTQGRPTVTTAWQMTMALGVAGSVLIVLEQPSETVARLQEGPILLLAYLGMVALAGSFFLMNYALRHLPAGH
ncbi:MAG: DMT family transporter, partial [Alphaproteobacteria bacterium]|nr:DMT family transporter [Alphaproteobacteria bacterium]